jgi:ribose 5-phosphate isomerase B
MNEKISIVVGADHRGYFLKEYCKNNFRSQRYIISWHDVGAFNIERSDYPVFAQAAVEEMLHDRASRAILFCGTGVGMAVAANRFRGIFAGVAWNEDVARRCKEDDNINALVIPADYIKENMLLPIVTAWLHAEFKHDRYEKRIAMINDLKIT